MSRLCHRSARAPQPYVPCDLRFYEAYFGPSSAQVVDRTNGLMFMHGGGVAAKGKLHTDFWKLEAVGECVSLKSHKSTQECPFVR